MKITLGIVSTLIFDLKLDEYGYIQPSKRINTMVRRINKHD